MNKVSVMDSPVANDPIVAIVSTLLSFPLNPPFRAAIRVFPTVEIALARVRTASGAEGVGYAFAFDRDDAATLASLIANLGTQLVGSNALAPVANWRRLWQSLTFLGQSGAGSSAMAAIDIALWDILGKVAGLPLYRLLGAARESIPSYGSGGSLAQDTAALVAEMEGYVAAGHRAVKFKLGHGKSRDVERLAAVRSAVGNEVRIIVDGNQQWTGKEALAMADALAPYEPWWLEEPIAASNLTAYAELRAASRIPIATGETNFGAGEFDRMLALRAADIVMPNLQRVGGITPWRSIAAACDLRDVPIASHVYAEFNVHLLCSIPNALTLEMVPWWPRLFVETLAIDDGMVRPPQGPGLGLTLDTTQVERHAV
jgi:L-alanine-DL-glutamate epimerase-like enolase superfamily enzyme